MRKGFPCFCWSLFDDQHTLIRCHSKGSPLSSGAIRRLARVPAPSLQSAPRLSTACGLTPTSASRLSAAASPIPSPFRHGSRRPASTTIGSSDSTTANTTASGPAAKRVLYSGHQPTSPLQRTAMAGWATVTALMDPERADMVATLGEVTGRLALEQLYRSMLADPEGREILRARPVINEATVDLAALARRQALPDGTLGKSYSNFMKENNFSPDDRSRVKYVDDPDLAYVMRRYREVDDLWHALTALPATVEGELALKWFELVQTGLPVCALSAVLGPLALPSKEPSSVPTTTPSSNDSSSSGSGGGGRKQRGSREVLARTFVPWAIRAGRRARRPLVCVWYEKRWEQPLELLRRDLGVEVAPQRWKGGEAPR
ncbi:unnamed protein product [Ectocarpus sp. 12 AP-2014]